jgi:hypothetical protein
MQIKLNLEKDSQLLEINPDLILKKKYREILPKHIEINGGFTLNKLGRILSGIYSSILSFGRIRVTEESLEDLQ